jgi:hypothetical protein
VFFRFYLCITNLREIYLEKVKYEQKKNPQRRTGLD